MPTSQQPAPGAARTGRPAPDSSLTPRSFADPDAPLSPAVARVIARDGYVFGFPMVDNYRIMHAYFLEKGNPEYKGPLNRISNTARVYTPDDKAIQTPNSDTPYSTVGCDLRAEPLVFTTPAVERRRYFSLQFIDLYTFNFAYAGSRATGNGPQTIVLAGPGWDGEVPTGAKLFRCETQLAMVLYRTQLFEPADIEAVKAIQAGYQVQPLSAFLGMPAPPAPTALAFPTPQNAQEERWSAHVFETLDFLLSLAPLNAEDAEVRGRLARLGVDGRGRFSADTLAPEIRAAVEQGIADAWVLYQQNEKLMTSHELTSGDVFGTRAFLAGNYLNRMTAAVDGIYGNSREEAIYPGYMVDADNRPIDTSLDHYQLRFGPGDLPPANAFWSLTPYDLPNRSLVANPLSRYLINSSMLPDLKKDADGGVTLYVQRDSPGASREANWLPMPNGPAIIALRIYWPKPEALSGKWKQPPLKRVG